MPLCIAGMHRSGTSMIASLLHACGLDLGPQNDFLPAAPSNPLGFWESRSFLCLNDAILKHLGGKWRRPPRRQCDGWEDQPGLHRLRKEAQKLIACFDGGEPWGWKDPRNCLTLPFWRKLLPDLKVLVCVRNPLAVAESLRLRNEIPHANSFDLWLTYNQRLLTASPADNRLVTHCDAYLHDPKAEIRRVIDWAGLDAAEEQVDRACRRIDPTLLHHYRTLDDLAYAGISDDLWQCYRELCQEATLHRGEAPLVALEVRQPFWG